MKPNRLDGLSQLTERVVSDASMKLFRAMTPQDRILLGRIVEAHYGPLVEAAEDFIKKVDTGLAKSTDSYNKFKRALGK